MGKWSLNIPLIAFSIATFRLLRYESDNHGKLWL